MRPMLHRPYLSKNVVESIENCKCHAPEECAAHMIYSILNEYAATAMYLTVALAKEKLFGFTTMIRGV